VQPTGNPTDVVTSLKAPWSIVFVGTVALISERDSGRILELTGSSTREVGTVDGVEHQGEGGLLGLAALAQGDTAYVYAYFTGQDDNRIVRYPLTGTAGAYGLGQVEPIFSGIPKAGNHNGGRIAFGPDGMLYATAGDAGRGGRAQDPNSLSGKILRLTPTGQVPADNPVAGNPMYSMGHRNPQGIGWDRQGNMWAAEFGQNTWDELNQIRPGANYGWPEVEGAAGDPRFVDPVHEWAPVDASPSGIAVVGDTVFIANLRGQRLTAVSLSDPAQATDYYNRAYGRLRNVVLAPDGSLWILTNNTDGRGDPADGDDRILSVQITR
jgi:glucose/arabinose dehydrogenase